jgi:ornithine decarboxylase
LQDVIPDFVRRQPERYRDVGLRDLAREMHGFYRQAKVSSLQRAQFRPENLPVPVITPLEASRMLTRNQVDYLPIREVAGRIATTLMLVYPPGIATVVPGERLDANASPMLGYLSMFEEAENRFPGFGTEIQGVYREVDATGRVTFYTYVATE